MASPKNPSPGHLKIDAHQHFWKYDAEAHAWITPDMKTIQRDFLPADLQPVLEKAGIDGCITVQVNETEEENEFMLRHASEWDFIMGVVGWVDLSDPAVAERLDHYKQFPKMKGFRHILQGIPDRAFMLKPAFKRGVGQLRSRGYTYDILIFPDQLGYTREFVASFPDQPFVIDHIAKPHIKDRYITEEWKDAMRAVAAYENVYCKISGMVTEADWANWKPEHLKVYIDTVVEAFGTSRIIYGSDWPVCLVAAYYDRVVGVVRDYFSSFSPDEQSAFFGGNAAKFYNL